MATRDELATKPPTKDITQRPAYNLENLPKRRLSKEAVAYMLSTPEPNPSGLCMCGCGNKTPISRQNSPRDGYIFGKPVRYVSRRHRRYKSPVEYTVEDRGYKTACWVWQRSRTSSVEDLGYGIITDIDDLQKPAYRVFYERKHGSVPDGLILDHLCRVRPCVNPDHLDPVTHQVNIQRGVHTKLSPESIREIVDLCKLGKSYSDIAKLFNVKPLSIYHIAIGKTWNNIVHGDDLPATLPRRKLSDNDVVSIRRLHYQERKTLKELSIAYGVTIWYMAGLCTGRYRPIAKE